MKHSASAVPLTRRALTASLGSLLIVIGLSPATFGQQGGAPSTSSVSSAVPNGTRFLVRLGDELSTRKHNVNKKFKGKTLDPLQTADGSVLAPGAEIRGHISRIERAGVTGRARMWLTFDEIKTPQGKLPLLADVVSLPGDHNARADANKEGEVEARTSKGRREVEAAAAGAAIGAVVGATTKGGGGAALGAAIGGAAGFLVASGIGQELDLPKGTMLELELTRPLYMAKQ